MPFGNLEARLLYIPREIVNKPEKLWINVVESLRDSTALTKTKSDNQQQLGHKQRDLLQSVYNSPQVLLT